MSDATSSIPAQFTPGTILEGRLSAAIVLEVHEDESRAILLLLPSGYRVIAKFWQIEAWAPAAALAEGWHIERVVDHAREPDWRVCLPDIESVAAILNDHHWHGGEPVYRYRVVPPDNATDDELTHIEDIGGIL